MDNTPALNVYINGEYGPFTVELALNMEALSPIRSLELIEKNLRRIKKAKSFVFYLSKPGDVYKADHKRAITVNCNEYNGLKGTIKPCHTEHGAFLGYDCKFFAINKSGSLNLKEEYSPSSKGLSPIAQKQLNLELSEHLIETALRSKGMLINRMVDKYLKQLLDDTTYACTKYKRELSDAQRRYSDQKLLLEQIQSIIAISLKSRKDDHPNDSVPPKALEQVH